MVSCPDCRQSTSHRVVAQTEMPGAITSTGVFGCMWDNAICRYGPTWSAWALVLDLRCCALCRLYWLRFGAPAYGGGDWFYLSDSWSSLRMRSQNSPG